MFYNAFLNNGLHSMVPTQHDIIQTLLRKGDAILITLYNLPREHYETI